MVLLLKAKRLVWKVEEEQPIFLGRLSNFETPVGRLFPGSRHFRVVGDQAALHGAAAHLGGGEAAGRKLFYVAKRSRKGLPTNMAVGQNQWDPFLVGRSIHHPF